MANSTRKKDGKPTRQVSSASSLSRGLDILRAFKTDDATLGNQELIERTGLPKATVSRLTSTLVSLSYLSYHDQLGRYSIGPGAISLGYSALSSIGVVRKAKPLMQRISDQTGLSVVLGAGDGTRMVCFAETVPETRGVLRVNVGSHLPMWRTALGLAYLTEIPIDVRVNLVDRLIAQEPDHRTLILKKVEEAFQTKMEAGFVMEFGNWYSHIGSIGVAFQSMDRSTIVSVACFGIADILAQGEVLLQAGSALIELVNFHDL